MAKANGITLSEFKQIHFNLMKISGTWSDLWLSLFLLRIDSGSVVSIKYSDIQGDILHLNGTKKFPKKSIKVEKGFLELVERRKNKNPTDVYIFQSRSNRVKSLTRPVTVIAMNMAIKKASDDIIDKNVSMKSASKIISIN